MFPINQFEIKKVEEKGNTGKFHIGPLPKGYGHTLGNVYRRILLSSVQGAAVTAVKLNGVQHEYTTLDGVQDDMLTLVLQLKGIAVVSHSDEPVRLSLKAKGKKGSPVEVTAADIEKNPMVEIVNPEYVVTTLTDSGSEIDAELIIEKGFGYALPNEEARKEIGTIPVDADFNPVRLVTISVTDTRVGQQTDLDLLQLEVTTNGAITPSAALHTAADILHEVSAHLLDTAKSALSKKAAEEVESHELPLSTEEETETVEKAPISVADLNLSTRLTNALLNSGYEDLHQLEGLTEEEVANIKGMGEKSLEELKEVLTDNEINLI